MGKADYFIAPLLLLIATVFLGGIVLLFVKAIPGTSKTYCPRAEIRFDLGKYSHAIEFNDFTHYPAFKDAQCNKCDLSPDAPVSIIELLEGHDISVSLYGGEGKFLRILFYGKDKEKINMLVKSVSDYLGKSEKFESGFEVCLDDVCAK